MSFRHYRMRLLILLLAFLMTGSILNCVDAFTYTMVFMENETHNSSNIRVYNSYEKNLMISMMAVGSLIGLVPFGLLYEKYGARYIMFGAGIFCSITTALLPISFDNSFGAATVIRLLQGVAFAADFSVVGLIASQWAPLDELGKFLAVLSAFTVLKALIQMPLAGWLVPVYGWRSLHYALAAVLCVVSFLWLFLYRDDPRRSWATSKEVDRIHSGKSQAHKDMKIAVPYKIALKDKQLWMLWIAALIDVMASIFWVIYSAKYLVFLGFDGRTIAGMSSLAGIFFLLAKLVTGVISDQLHCLSPLSMIRLFTLTSLGVSAIVNVFVGLTSGWTSFILLIVFQIFIATNVGAFYKSAVLMARQYSHFVVGQLQLLKTISFLVIPGMVSLVIPEDTTTSWMTMCFIWSGLLLFGCVLLLISASDRPFKWVEDAEKTITPEEKQLNHRNSMTEVPRV